MVAALWLLADAASEGRKVVLSMLVVGLVFLAVILLGDLSHYASNKRRRNKLDRPL
jgi:predicted membrane protein